MKNKAVTYLLIAAVVLIWSWIMYSIFDYTSEKTSTGTEITAVVHKRKDIIIPEKEYILKLSYTDPFLKKRYTQTYPFNNGGSAKSFKSVNKKKQVKLTAKNITPTITILPKSVRYMGHITNARNTSKPVAILLIDHKEYMLHEGETADDVGLLKIMPDSVFVLLKSVDRKVYIRK